MKSIRWKIIFLGVIVVLIPVLFLNYYSIHTFNKFTSRDLDDHMIHSAFIVGEQYKAMFNGDGHIAESETPRLTQLARSYGREIQSRIQVLSSIGFVLADSATNSDENTDLSYFPEVKSALEGRYGARSTLTDDKKYMYYYIAYPIMRDGQVCGVAYISRHTGNIVKTIIQMVTEIQRINRHNREFISTIMHELKMPITAIKGAAELLECKITLFHRFSSLISVLRCSSIVLSQDQTNACLSASFAGAGTLNSPV